MNARLSDNAAPLRYGIIGCGDMARTHAMNLALRPEFFRVVALFDPVAAHMDNVQAKLPAAHPPARRYADFRGVIEDAEVDAVIVATPNSLHTEPVVSALEAGKHVFCEKPFATRLEDCDRMIAARDRSGRALQIGLVLRYARAFEKMAELIGSGRIGQPLMAWCQEFRSPFPIGNGREWRFDSALSGGAILEKDCHHFDLFEWLLGARTTRVQAFGGRAVVEAGRSHEALPNIGEFDRLVRRNDIVDHAMVNLDFDTGARANLLLCFFAPNNGLPFGVLGSKGRFLSNLSRRADGFFMHENARTWNYGERLSDGEWIAAEDSATGEGFIVHPGGLRQHLSFLEAARGRAPVFCTAEIGRRATAVALAAEQSIRSGGAVVAVPE
jgi:predicted dehydrogenase